MEKFIRYFKRKSKEDHDQLPEALARQRSRVDFQVSCLTAVVVIISCYLIFFLNYYFSYRSMIGDLQDRALNIHDFLESSIDNDTFLELNSREDSSTSTYQNAKKLLEETKHASGVRYLYTAKKKDNGDFIYVVDGLAEDSFDFRYIGDLIEPECIPDMTNALNGQVVLPQEINKTTWGPIFITYFPMHHGDEIVGVLGIEFDAERQYGSFRTMTILTPIVIIIFCLVAAFIALKWFRRISNPSYRDIASIDFLTGLKNRNSFEIDLNNLAQQSNLLSIGILSLDLDGLKLVNDTYGHEMGDYYIKLGCKIVQKNISPEDAFYRMGGDEFSVVLKNKTAEQIEEIQNLIKKQQAEISKNQMFSIRISMGYAQFNPDLDKTLFDTLKRADAVMYECKKRGKAERKKASTKTP